MKAKRKDMREEEIDRMVIAQARDKTAWEKPVKVRRAKATSVSLSSTLATRAAFFCSVAP